MLQGGYNVHVDFSKPESTEHAPFCLCEYITVYNTDVPFHVLQFYYMMAVYATDKQGYMMLESQDSTDSKNNNKKTQLF